MQTLSLTQCRCYSDAGCIFLLITYLSLPFSVCKLTQCRCCSDAGCIFLLITCLSLPFGVCKHYLSLSVVVVLTQAVFSFLSHVYLSHLVYAGLLFLCRFALFCFHHIPLAFSAISSILSPSPSSYLC